MRIARFLAACFGALVLTIIGAQPAFAAPHAYWRLYLHSTSGGSYFFLSTVEFRSTLGGAQQATGGTPFSYSTFNNDPNNAAANAFDTDVNTVYGSNSGGDGELLGYHFATPVSVQQVTLTSRANAGTAGAQQAPSSFSVQYSDDGQSYTNDYDVSTPTNWTAGEVRSFNDPNPASTALAIGSLSAVGSPAGIALSLSSGLSAGAGSGYSYAIYRGSTPDFTEGPASLLATQTSLPFLDTSASVGVQEYYGIVGSDSAGATVNALPSGISAIAATPSKALYASTQRQSPAIALVNIGDSITAGTGSSTPPQVFEVARLQKLSGLHTIGSGNYGVGGSATTDWQPTGSYYNAAKSGMSSLLAASSNSVPVLSIMLGTNDSPFRNDTVYAANVKAIVDQWLIDFPTSKIIINAPPYYTPNTQNGGTYLQAGLNTLATYSPALQGLVASYAGSQPNRVFMGDTSAFAFFSEKYQSEMQADSSGPNGVFYLHPNTAGAQDLGEMWATALWQALYGATAATATKPGFRPGFHSP